MVRWEPGTLERLQLAALELFEERGYAGTTVADIASRAGLTERTFYRHYADKREVLVAGSAELTALFTSTIAAQADGTHPLAAVEAAISVVGEFFDSRRAFAVRRHAVIASCRELAERELSKLDALTASVAEALQARGVDAGRATLVAAVGIAAFHVTFGRWVADDLKRAFGVHSEAVLAELRQSIAAVG